MADDARPDEFTEPPRPPAMKSRRTLEDTELDITPMIDITFLLLIFFVVSSKMEQAANVPLPPAKTGVAIVMKHAVIITVGPGDTEDSAKIYAGDGDAAETLLDSSDANALETELKAYVEEQVSLDSRKTTVLIKGAKGVKHKHISTTAKAAAAVAEITDMAWAVMEEQ
ncbi:MAG: biopolymer transporter ExbD [Planctomycetia bacterium]|nr:biopolymer transporter ExbD [Planctomycetia bacterium]